MLPGEAVAFAQRFMEDLPEGWGFLCFEDDYGQVSLSITENEPPLPSGWMIWLSKRMLGGGILKGGVIFSEKDEPKDVEARAWIVLGLLRGRETRVAARWN